MRAGHQQYRSRLDALADPAALNGALDAWCSRQGTPEGGSWQRDFGRFYPGQDPWAVLALDSGSLVLRADAHEDAAPDRLPIDGVGHVRVYGPEQDAGLPGLGEVLTAFSVARVVRYRPNKRCTATGTTEHGPRFVKVLPNPSPLYCDAVELWESSRRGELGFTVAEPHGADGRTGALWQGVVRGNPVMGELSGPDGAALARRMGVALASLACSATPSSVVAGPDVQLARTERALQRAQNRVPDLGPQLRAVVDALRSWHGRLSWRPLVAVHGAPHVHQWLADGGRLGLIDFDRFAQGEPELDVATFLAELDGDESLLLPIAVLEASLEQGYREGGIELDHDRLLLHRTHKRLAKVARAAFSLRPDGDDRAARHLRAVCTALGL